MFLDIFCTRSAQLMLVLLCASATCNAMKDDGTAAPQAPEAAQASEAKEAGNRKPTPLERLLCAAQRSEHADDPNFWNMFFVLWHESSENAYKLGALEGAIKQGHVMTEQDRIERLARAQDAKVFAETLISILKDQHEIAKQEATARPGVLNTLFDVTGEEERWRRGRVQIYTELIQRVKGAKEQAEAWEKKALDGLTAPAGGYCSVQ